MLIAISEDEPLNADESEETEALILTAIEERVRVRNERNSALVRVKNPVEVLLVCLSPSQLDIPGK